MNTFSFLFAESFQGPHEKRLLNHLLAAYNTLERPVANESEALQVKFGLTLQQIIDVVSSNISINYFSCLLSLSISIWFLVKKIYFTISFKCKQNRFSTAEIFIFEREKHSITHTTISFSKL